jgi:hypothetical protein
LLQTNPDIEAFAGDVRMLAAKLHKEGSRRVYVDGGSVIRQFLWPVWYLEAGKCVLLTVPEAKLVTLCMWACKAHVSERAGLPSREGVRYMERSTICSGLQSKRLKCDLALLNGYLSHMARISHTSWSCGLPVLRCIPGLLQCSCVP